MPIFLTKINEKHGENRAIINHQSGVVYDIIWALSNQGQHTTKHWNVIQDQLIV